MKKLLISTTFIFFSVTAVFSQTPSGSTISSTQTNQDDVILETLGTSSGLLMYQIFVSIGAVADGFFANAYDAKTVSDLMTEQANSCMVINTQYQKLLDSGFLKATQDQEYTRDFMATVTLLAKEASALKNYASDKSETNSEIYLGYRDQAWASISKLLGFEK